MKSVGEAFGFTEQGEVTCDIYEDGDVVLCHDGAGGVKNMQGVSGYGPILNLCDVLDIPPEIEDDVLDYVHQKNEFIEAE